MNSFINILCAHYPLAAFFVGLYIILFNRRASHKSVQSYMFNLEFCILEVCKATYVCKVCKSIEDILLPTTFIFISFIFDITFAVHFHTITRIIWKLAFSKHIATKDTFYFSNVFL